MKVEILEERLKAKDRETGQHYTLEKGDRVTVSDECGHSWCAAGWAKDLSGDVPTGERKPGARRLDVQSTRHASVTTTNTAAQAKGGN